MNVTDKKKSRIVFFSFSRNYLGFSVQFNSALFRSYQIITTESGQGALYCTGKILQYSGVAVAQVSH